MKILIAALFFLVFASAALAGDRTYTLSAQQEQTLTWRAQVAGAGVTEAQVFQALVTRTLAQLRQEMIDRRFGKLLAKFQDLTPQQQADVLAIIGTIDEPDPVVP